jgi:hypothetical protein
MDVLWSLLILTVGFLLGSAVTLMALVVSRTRAEAARAGDELLKGLGPVGAKKFIEAAQE